MKKTKLILLISVLIFSFIACTKKYEPKIGKNNYFISQKNPIKKENKRIVSVSPQITELLCDIGCKNRLVGRTDFCKFPPEVKNIPSVGGINNANVEKIISLQPDIVITSSIFTKKMFSIIENAGIPIISFKESNKIEGMYNVITMLGEITNKQDAAKTLINNCKKQLEIIKKQRDSINLIKRIYKKPKVYYVVDFGPSGDFSGGKDTYINEIISLSGGDNIAKDCKMWSFSKEQLFNNQPDYIFVRKEDYNSFIKMYPYNKLLAVKNHKVFPIESSLLDIQTPRSIKAIEFISKIISTH